MSWYLINTVNFKVEVWNDEDKYRLNINDCWTGPVLKGDNRKFIQYAIKQIRDQLDEIETKAARELLELSDEGEEMWLTD